MLHKLPKKQDALRRSKLIHSLDDSSLKLSLKLSLKSSKLLQLPKFLMAIITVTGLNIISQTSIIKPAVADTTVRVQLNSYCKIPIRNGAFNGRGVCYFPSGNRFQGEFVDGMRQGVGTFTYADGSYCEGVYSNNQLNGRAVCKFSDGNNFTGMFLNGVRQGLGIFTYANGISCQGEFRDDLLNGRGICAYPSGNRYEGEFQNGRKNGNGIFIYANGARVQGTWRNGKFRQAITSSN
jgi:hypothetical protein